VTANGVSFGEVFDGVVEDAIDDVEDEEFGKS
jgi:hypothetical protein